MKRRDVTWIAAIWIVALGLMATVAAFFADNDPETNDAAGALIVAALLGALATGGYVHVRRRSSDRRDVFVVATIWVFLLAAIVVPGVMTGNGYAAGLAVGLVGGLLTDAYLDRSRKRRRPVQAAGPVQAAAPGPKRTCPRCDGHIGPEASTCPFCGLALTPWTFHAGFWWRQMEPNVWQWLDEPAGVWKSDGSTPSTPSVTTTTHGLAPDSAPVDPDGR